MSVAIQHYVARLTAEKEQEMLVSIFSSSFFVYVVGAVIALLLCFYLSHIFSDIFTKVPTEAARQCSTALRWVGAGMFLLLINIPIQGALFGLQRHYIRNSIEILGLGARAVTVLVLFLFFGPSLVYLGVAFFTGICLRFLLCRVALWRINPELRFRPSMVNLAALKQIFSYGGHSFIWTICTVLIRDSAPILAVLLISSEAGTFWYIGNRVVVAIGGLIKGAGQVFVPIASSFYGSEKWEDLKTVLIRSTRFCGLFGLSGAVALLLFGRDLINFWVGPGYSKSYQVLIIITIGWISSWTFGAAEAILIGIRKLWVLTNMILFRLIAGIGLAIIMGHYWGILGLTMGLVIPTAINSTFLIPYFASKACKIKVSTLLSSSLPVPLAISLVVLVCIVGMKMVLPPTHIGIFIAECAVTLAVFGTLALMLGLDPTSRGVLLGKLGFSTSKAT